VAVGNYTRGGETFRAEANASGQKMPMSLSGEMQRVSDGVQSIALSGAGVNTLTVPALSTHALIYAEGASDTDLARYWHGVNPTTAVGKRLRDHEEMSSADPSQFRATLGAGSASLTLRIEYYHYA